MKTRTGFVSNSSTSSFLILGTKLENYKLTLENKKMLLDAAEVEYEDDQDAQDAFWDCMQEGLPHGLSIEDMGNFLILGLHLTAGSESYVGVTDTETIIERIDTVKAAIKELALKANIKELFGEDAKIQLFSGTKYC